jgi:hypothetical protein
MIDSNPSALFRPAAVGGASMASPQEGDQFECPRSDVVKGTEAPALQRAGRA